jgi:hypothetical protein
MTSAKIIALEVPAPSSAMATACRQRVSQDRKGLFGKDTATRPGSAMQTVDPPAFASAPKRWRSAHTHLAYKRVVTGSNPVAPTKRDTSNVIMELAGSDAERIAGRVASRSPQFRVLGG